jgi:putative colanic acid biosynthesis UDP-glucose lipid carrier transferase
MEISTRKGNILIQWIIGVGDLIILNLIFYIVYSGLNEMYTEGITAKLREVALFFNFCYFFALYFVPLKVHASVVFIDKIVQRSILLVTFFTFFMATCLLFLNVGDELGTFIIVFYTAAVVVFTLWRVIARLMLKYFRSRGRGLTRVLIVGGGKNGLELYGMMKEEEAYGFKVLGFFDDNIELKEVLPNYLGATAEVNNYVQNNEVDEIYCTLPGTQDEKMRLLLNFAENKMIRFYIVPEFYRNVKKSFVMDIMGSIPLLSVRREPLQASYNRAIKRFFDIVFSIIILFTIFPIMYIVLGIMIKFSSPGPVLFKQIRTGLYGHDFKCYKFRTMKVNEEADTTQAQENDPRKTRLGDFLRKTNLDEFPQFINVLTGDMSVVGPRPHMIKHTEDYSARIDKYMVRHLVKPGVTGWAQVTGYRGETKTLEQMEGRIKRDVWYIENWSFFLDLKIIVVTVINMFRGERNAY